MAWYVDFTNGFVGMLDKSITYGSDVRLVRRAP
jgi:hypothetical protein